MTTHTADRAARGLIGFGLLAAFWIAYLPLPFPEFYKEWAFAMAIGLCALLLGQTSPGQSLLRHPLVIAALGVVAALGVQSITKEGVWPKAVLMVGYAGFFVTTIMVGRALFRSRGEESLSWLAGLLVAAALGSCFFAALQLNWIDFSFPVVARRSGDRLSGNTAQPNHFATLLWLGVLATALLHARGRVTSLTAWLTVVVFEAFSLFSGARMTLVYVVLTLLLGLATLLRRPSQQVQRLAHMLVAVAVAFIAVSLVMAVSGVYGIFGVSSGGNRAVSAEGETSTGMRLWYWKAAIDATSGHPLLGIGVGHYVGHTHRLAMSQASLPPRAVEANAHNIFLHLAAELGIPVSLLVAACVAVWLKRVWGLVPGNLEAMAVLMLAGAVLVHANLEYPLWFLYFLGLLGLIVGHLPQAPDSVSKEPTFRILRRSSQAAGVAVVVSAVLAYHQFRPLERAMQTIVGQVELGAAPQRDQALNDTLADVPFWSPYRDYAEAIFLITARPTSANARDLSERCNRLVGVAPSSYLLARCATALQVAGEPARATYFAEGLCKLHPAAVGILIESMNYVESTSPVAGTLVSSCVERLP